MKTIVTSNYLRSIVISILICFPALVLADDVDYGAGKVNSMAANKTTQAGGPDDYHYLALENHHGPSGVPVGGIGVGCFDYAPNGAFTRIAINNWHSEGGENYCLENVPGSFIALWDSNKSHLLRRDSDRGVDNYAGMKLAQKTVYRGLFPMAECEFDDSETVRVWSGLAPQDVKDSSLPLAWVEVDLANSSNEVKPMAVAFSWQDVIGRKIRDIQDKGLIAKMDGKSVWDRETILSDADKAGKKTWDMLPREATSASTFAAGRFTGVRQHSAPLESNLKTFQNYNNEVAVLAEKETDAEITTLPAYEIDAPTASWEGFRKDGRFPVTEPEQPLFDPAAQKEKASAVAVRVNLMPGEKRTIRFLVAWFQPEIDLTKAAPGSYFGKADYGKYYMNYFKDLPSLVDYAGLERERIESETRSWQKPILESSYPEWLKFKVINSAYTLYTNTILNKKGDFTVMEGGMGGLAGTMDQRISAHPFYFKFFTQLDRSDLELFGSHPGREGEILHFDGHYYFGFDSPDGTTPVPENWMVDNSGGWLLQVAKDYQQSGDLKWLEQFRDRIPRALNFLRAHIASKVFHIVSGPTTYDDFWHPDIYAYNATTWPAFLKAGAVLERALGDNEKAEECNQESLTASKDALRALWNGNYFAYGAELDGSQRRDDIMFSGQLAGQFMSRCFGLGDVLPMNAVRASVVAQLKTNVIHSPDYYAPKVWLIKEAKAMNDPRRPNDPNADSTCWPFYLESYTAMAAIQAGYVDDGLDIMRHIQLLNLRNGWTWSQNLWRPGEQTYVTAPVSWFITDVLAGAGLDVSSGTLIVSPVLNPQEDKATLPVYFPRFWGFLNVDRTKKCLTLQVTRVFGTPDIIIKHVVAQPVGISTTVEKTFDIPPFTIEEGARLDLSSHWNEFMDSVQQKAVLPEADHVPFTEVPLSKLVH